MTSPDPFAAAREREAESAKEYGTYTAVDVIYLGGARAFNVGDPVPVSHVENKIVNAAQVSKTATEKKG